MFSLIIGICFGLWPFIMNKSNLDLRFAPILASIIALIMTTINLFYFSPGELKAMNSKNLLLGFLSSVVCSFGVIMFYKILSKTSVQDLAISFIIITLIQVSIPVLINIVVSGELTLNKAVGFLCAFLSIYFLNK
jgi:uncharacterized membrane protein